MAWRRIYGFLLPAVVAIGTGCAAFDLDFCACDKQGADGKCGTNSETRSGSTILPKITRLAPVTETVADDKPTAKNNP
jgi:hypothetical protein